MAINKCAALAALVDRYTDGKGDSAHTTVIESLTFKREQIHVRQCSIWKASEESLVFLLSDKGISTITFVEIDAKL
ncbi:MAG: hypothetical protein JO235_12705 [Chroococcidiopsidaceae cyanobacterium CP_BM_RX_35]|nr:hypothetical protein [Chroococcidiopsidaceae cyanobacterium CP_BM_RX_35]